MFLRYQMSPYCVGEDDGCGGLQPAMHYEGPCPHGRYDVEVTTTDGDVINDVVWGRDEYGYNDFDDYHLSIYGA